MKFQVKEQMKINAPASEVWHILAHEFDKVSEWSSGLTASEPSRDIPIPEGALVGGRLCYSDGIGGDVEEAFTYYDEAGMRFGYEAVGDIPAFFKQAENNWQVRELNGNQSIVSFLAHGEMTFFPGIFLLLFFPIVKKVWGTQTLEELKYYVENGRPHPRKIKAQQKQIKTA